MVELTLPKNSQLSPGKSWPRPASKNVREFRVYR
jgi:succinate dehydrogenase / fumarate reductase, iron-sulfur subunit